ncbi:MAG: ATP-binding protein [Clostridia bacterium]
MRELSLNIMDVTQNSVTAKADLIKISIVENDDEKSMEIKIEDNGCGMSEETVRKVIDPFYTTRTTRDVGLGIPLFKMQAEMTGGSFEISSKVGIGTKISAVFITSHIDMMPLGDINSTILPLITGNENIDFLYTRVFIKNRKEKSFALDTREVKDELGEDVSLSLPDVVLWLMEYLKENTEEIIDL